MAKSSKKKKQNTSPAEPSRVDTPAVTAEESEQKKAGMFHFVKDMGSALMMALVAIIYVIQAFKIPTSSMEKSLLIGDFLLGLKFIYGAPVLPFSYLKFPAVDDVTPGDVVIFEFPGNDNRDYIKRCVAGPGQTLEVQQTKLIVDGKERVLPPNGMYVHNGNLRTDVITNFAPLRIPAKGDTLKPSELPSREFIFAKNLITQEHPRNRIVKFLENPVLGKGLLRQNLDNEKVKIQYQLYVDGALSNETPLRMRNGRTITISQINRAPQNITIDNWVEFHEVIKSIDSLARENFPGQTVAMGKALLFEGKPLTQYVVKNDNYFMMGDNRDNSLDSRYWGYLNRNYVKAKAFILYFSWNGYRWCSHCKTYTAPDGHNYHYINGRGGDTVCRTCHRRLKKSVPIYLKIRWNRLGKLIRSWDKAED